MAKPISPLRPARRLRPPPEVPLLALPPEPGCDLAAVTIPDWLMPAVRDLMEVAERTLPEQGPFKKLWVRRALLDAFAAREQDHPDFELAPTAFRADLIDILIEAVWGLQLGERRGSGTLLAEALGKVKDLGRRLSRERERQIPA